jgi:hypothetical protein
MSLVIEPAFRCDLTKWHFATHQFAHNVSDALIADKLTDGDVFEPPKRCRECRTMDPDGGSDRAERKGFGRTLIDHCYGFPKPLRFAGIDVIAPCKSTQ